MLPTQVVVHYVLCIIGCSTCGLAATFAGVALNYCYSDDPETFYQCLPVRDVKLAFTIVDIVGGALLFPTCIAACVLFCLHSQTLFGSQLQRFQTLEAEVRACACVCVCVCVWVCVCVCVCVCVYSYTENCMNSNCTFIFGYTSSHQVFGGRFLCSVLLCEYLFSLRPLGLTFTWRGCYG